MSGLDQDAPGDNAALRKFLLLLLMPFAIVVAAIGLTVGIWFAGLSLGYTYPALSAVSGALNLGMFIAAAKLVGWWTARSVDSE